MVDTAIDTSRVNEWLVAAGIRVSTNPCVSPDFCLDWPALQQRIGDGHAAVGPLDLSEFSIAEGTVRLWEDSETGDCAWEVRHAGDGDAAGNDLLPDDGAEIGAAWFYPATWRNLIELKNLVLEADAEATIFPTARGQLDHSSLGIGARFTTLHWPAVDWTMAQLGLPLVANQNSIPRELVFDVNVMLDEALDKVPYKFIGGEIPEGHQGQSVEGMSHGAVLTKLRHGFHRHGIPWGFNADHQPIGGKYDAREDALVRGSLFATYITFDISHELVVTEDLDDDAAASFVAFHIDQPVRDLVTARLRQLSTAAHPYDPVESTRVMAKLWRAMQKMKVRDTKYIAARNDAFSTAAGRAFFRELSIDELPGLTSRTTLITVLALCEALSMEIHFIAPAFGFQKNFPFDDNDVLRERIASAYEICAAFGVSIGFHSGSGKSAENYNVCGAICGPNLEIKTSGRYTYEMGVALAASSDAADQALWRDWYAFTNTIAVRGAFSDDAAQRQAARSFLAETGRKEGVDFGPAFEAGDADACAEVLAGLTPSPDHMHWFEYNFLFVLAADGSADPLALGDHSAAGYAQRARFYGISDEGRLLFSKGVASYICFLAETTRKVPADRAARVLAKLNAYTSLADLTADIAPSAETQTVAAVLTLVEPGTWSLEDQSLPSLKPGPHEARVRVRAIGVCGTDYHAYTGTQPFFSYPRRLGHELAVEVVDVDPNNEFGLMVGDRCAVEPYVACGSCIACRKDRSNCCTRLKVMGVHMDGGFAREMIVPVSKLHQSDTLRFDQLVVVEPLCIGAHAVHRSGMTDSDTVVVVGTGPVGMAVIQSSLSRGARVIAVDIIDTRLEFVRVNLGVEETINASNDDVVAALGALTAGEMASVVIDATGNPRSMNNSFALVASAGTLVFVGLHKQDVTFDDQAFHRRELTVLSSRNALGSDFRAVIDAIEDGRMSVDPWVTHRCDDLSAFADAFDIWRDPTSGVIKAIVELD